MDSDDASGYSTGVGDDYESLLSTTDAELLKRAWQNEKAAPEILQFEAALVQRSREQIQLMIDQKSDSRTTAGENPTRKIHIGLRDNQARAVEYLEFGSHGDIVRAVKSEARWISR
ncbi:hypothetical protein HAX54_031513 [Datura stramonium]|uniref:Uncharacterized protein n=1 Tax=Datura stramonium TaxID=4076 RepID=A0ABS8RJ13_DATST|nr:hypothetical protein [Datura stramonium]